MNTPIADFINSYIASGARRLHMPGHKGSGPLGFEKYDITEIKDADALYEAEGIIAESEQNAAALFGTGRTLYSTEGSSQCIRAMLHLAITQRPAGHSNLILAARNVHKAFIYSAALTGFDVDWLFPETSTSICACPITPAALEKKLSSLESTPAAVYVTSPDYLGGLQDIKNLSEICHNHNTLLIVDNAHGAYLHFTAPAMHPMDLGADICCDSAHKTLPVLTGGAYLHLAKHLPERYSENAKQAMALFGSTSPSYLIMASLDLCNPYLASAFPADIARTAEALTRVCNTLRKNGWIFDHAEPLKLTVHASETGLTGIALADRLRAHNMECEFSDADDLVLMLTPNNAPEDISLIPAALGTPNAPCPNQNPTPAAPATPDSTTPSNTESPQDAATPAPWLPCQGELAPQGLRGSIPIYQTSVNAPTPPPHLGFPSWRAGAQRLRGRSPLPTAAGKRIMTIREAFFAPHETIPARDSLGCICAAPTVACPPAIPIAISGEIITEEAVALFAHYGVTTVEVVK